LKVRRLVPALIALLALLIPVASATAAPKPQSGEEFTPVVGSIPQAPEPVLGSDGRIHLAYELVLTNRPVIYEHFKPAAATVDRVRVLAGKKVLLSMGKKEIAALTDRFGNPEPGTKFAPGQTGFVAMDVTLPRGAKVPSELTHELSISLHPSHGIELTAYETGTTPVSKRTAAVIAPPLRGDGWIVNESCCAVLNLHRRGLLPVNGKLLNAARYAINFTQLQPGGNLLSGPPDRLSSYPYYGEPVYSVAPGTVVSAVDGMPEARLGYLPSLPFAKVGGNEIVVRMAGGRYATYSQLRTGSVAVRVGQKVRTGQVLGTIGSSGYTSSPQFEFRVTDGPQPRASDSIPFRFDHFTVDGRLANFRGLFEGQKARIEPEFDGPHVDELPLAEQVVNFP
jgi:hypothetical protein